eukprot:4152767-Amphidinium_carterae.1
MQALAAAEFELVAEFGGIMDLTRLDESAPRDLKPSRQLLLCSCGLPRLQKELPLFAPCSSLDMSTRQLWGMRSVLPPLRPLLLL